MSARAGLRIALTGSALAVIAGWIVFAAHGDWWALVGLLLGVTAGVMMGCGFSFYIEAVTDGEGSVEIIDRDHPVPGAYLASWDATEIPEPYRARLEEGEHVVPFVDDPYPGRHRRGPSDLADVVMGRGEDGYPVRVCERCHNAHVSWCCPMYCGRCGNDRHEGACPL